MQRSKITQLPPEIKAEFDRKLVESGFGNYDGIVEWLNERLTETELEISISRSSAARYGQEFERRLSAIKIATEQARAITGAVGDEEGAMNEALIRLVQQKAFDVLLNLEDNADREALIPKIGVMVSRITRASVTQKKWHREVKSIDDLPSNVDRPALFLESLKFIAGILKETDPEGLKILAQNFDEIVDKFKVQHANAS